jgi:hypothetical protein
MSRLADGTFEIVPLKTITEIRAETGFANSRLEDLFKSLVDSRTTRELQTPPEKIELIKQVLIKSQIGLSIQRELSFEEKQSAVCGVLKYFCGKTKKSAELILAEKEEMKKMVFSRNDLRDEARKLDGIEKEKMEEKISDLDCKIRKESMEMEEMAERLGVDLGVVYLQLKNLLN